jgi:hypothetical protein
MSQFAEIAIKNGLAAIHKAIQVEEIYKKAQKESARDEYIESCRKQHPLKWACIANRYRCAQRFASRAEAS